MLKQNIFFIAQNVDIFKEKPKEIFAQTGKISFHHLKAIGVSGLILGHCEIKDSLKIVNEKFKSALKKGFRDNIIFIDDGQKNKFKKNILKVLSNIEKKNIKKTVFCFEPNYYIVGHKNNGRPINLQAINTKCLLIRDIIKEKYGEEIYKDIKIIYGGGCSLEKSKQILKLKNIDGLALGSESVNLNLVKKITKEILKNKKEIIVLNFKAYKRIQSMGKYVNFFKKNKKLRVYLSPAFTDFLK